MKLVALLPVLAISISLFAACDPPVGDLRDESVATGEAGILDDDGGLEEAGEGGLVPVNFGRDIRPLMNRPDTAPYGCKRCHYRDGDDPQGLEIGGLDLTTLGSLRLGGNSSKSHIVVAGDPDNSAIVQKLEGTYFQGARMPKDRTPWSDAEIGLVRRWIAEGAKGADDE